MNAAPKNEGLVCTCEGKHVVLPRGAYCEICHADLVEAENAPAEVEAEEYTGPNAYDKARDEIEAEGGR